MQSSNAATLPNDYRATLRSVALAQPVRPVAAIGGLPLQCQFHALDCLPEGLLAQWPILAEHAAEPNCFVERWFLEPSLTLLANSNDIKIAAVECSDGMLVGLVPLITNGRYLRIPLPAIRNWNHSNSFLGVPMVRLGMEKDFWIAILKALDDASWARGIFHISGLTEDGPAHQGLQAAALKLDRQCDVVHRTQRALLETSLSPDDYWRTAVRAKKRKDIRRLERRLEEIGKTRFSRLGELEDPNPWIEAFLAMELGGWKGQAGSALASDPATAELFRTAARSAHELKKLDFCRLELDGEPLAMLISFLAPPGAFGFKTAFDERYSRYSPGVILQRYNLNILSRPDIDWVDSCAAENHPMIDSLWSDKRSIIRASVSLSGRMNRLIFRIGRRIEKLAKLLRLLRSRGSNQDA